MIEQELPRRELAPGVEVDGQILRHGPEITVWLGRKNVVEVYRNQTPPLEAAPNAIVPISEPPK